MHRLTDSQISWKCCFNEGSGFNTLPRIDCDGRVIMKPAGQLRDGNDGTVETDDYDEASGEEEEEEGPADEARKRAKAAMVKLELARCERFRATPKAGNALQDVCV